MWMLWSFLEEGTKYSWEVEGGGGDLGERERGREEREGRIRHGRRQG